MAAKKRLNVAMFTFGIGDISGGGGAERFFADLFDEYQQYPKSQFNLFWIIDKQSASNLKHVGKGLEGKNFLEFAVVSNRFKVMLEKWQLLYFILRYRISIVHVPMYNQFYYPHVRFLGKLPAFMRPALSVNIVDCSLPYCYHDANLPRHEGVVKTYQPLFALHTINGYLAWNQNFKEFAAAKSSPVASPYVYAIKSRFCKTQDYYPQEKQNVAVFASRLAVFKNTDWYIKAIDLIKKNNSELIKSWKFLVCGDGPLKQELVQLATDLGLNDHIEFRTEPTLYKVLNHSKIFISCQDFDNFPSMSMAEAMASGNVIVSRNVGQTNLFVREQYNGYLAKEDTVAGIADALTKALTAGDKLDVMASNSVKMMTEVHTVPAFIEQLDEFWNTIYLKA